MKLAKAVKTVSKAVPKVSKVVFQGYPIAVTAP